MLPEKEIANFQTPEFLADLGYTLMYIKNGNTIADIACGTGEFLKFAANKENEVSLYGCDINTDAYQELKSSKLVSSTNITLERRDAFSLIGEKQFDNVFVHPPFGQRMKIEGALEQLIKDILQTNDFPRETLNSDLLFALLAAQLIKDEGSAIAIVSASSCSNENGKFLRKCLFEGGYIGTAISLPSKMLDNTSVPIVALGLGKNRASMFMFDGTIFGTKEGRKKLRDGSGVLCINMAFQMASKDIINVSDKDIVQADYDFMPNKYFDPPYSYKYEVPLQDVLQILRRGVINGNKAQSRLNEFGCYTGTSRFVRANNLDNCVFSGTLGKIDKENVPANAIELEEGDILLSKTGKPFKCAIVDEEPYRKTYFQENIYLLRVDRNKIDPYFLCAFFNSQQGEECLSNALVKGGTSSLPIQKLKQVKIPLPQMHKQHEEAEFFKSQVKKIKTLMKKVEDARKSLKLELFYDF